MNREIHRLLAALLLGAWLLAIPALGTAQDAESDDAAAAAPDAGAEPPPPALDPTNSPLAVDPKSADELFDATLMMVDIARIDFAKLYLNKLMEQPLDDATLMALRDKYGAAAFLKLVNVPELSGPATKLLDMSNAAAIKQASDPARVARLISDLEGEPQQKAEAEAELQALGPAVVPGLLRVLNTPAQEPKYEAVMQAILRIGDAVAPILVGALDAPRETFRANVISMLGNLRASTAVPYLWYPAMSADELPAVRRAALEALALILKIREPGGPDTFITQGAVARMLKSAREQFRNQAAWPVDEAGKTSLWMWSDSQGTVVRRLASPEEASDIAGLRFAREAVALAPERRDTQVLFLCLSLAADIRRGGFDRPVLTGPGTAHDLALSVGSEIAVDVIAEAFNSTRPIVAVAALRVFSQIGTLQQMNLNGTGRSVVTAALDYPDQRVQFAAATAILQIDPKSTFRGAPRVVEILKRALGSDGRPHAVVAEVSVQRGTMIGGFLRELGYEPLVFMSGREAFAAAAARTDVELVVLHPNIIRWPLTETMANLRADTRTANIPIVIHGPGRLADKMKRRVQDFALVSFTLSSESTEDFDFQVRPFLRSIKTPPMTPPERAAQRADAATWLAHIAQGRRTKIFDITSAEGELSETLEDQNLGPAALEALGEIATRSSQQRIADLVLDNQFGLDMRRTAALKLAFHIQRFGLLLKQGAIDRLHKMWQSERENPELRTAVGSVIGSLKPDAILAGKRLKAQANATR
jgi:hypothetical protein